ncbi:unnamed protein product [Musa banksii]
MKPTERIINLEKEKSISKTMKQFPTLPSCVHFFTRLLFSKCFFPLFFSLF